MERSDLANEQVTAGLVEMTVNPEHNADLVPFFGYQHYRMFVNGRLWVQAD